jgi:hypothetical protein
MRKGPISGTSDSLSAPVSWLDIETAVTAELSSEDPEHPFERALRADIVGGWRASDPGPQLIRLRFDIPQLIRHIHLEFREEDLDRSQEIALFATSKTAPRKELVRQQWAFSPHGSNVEVEDFYFDLEGVVTLELEIDPGRNDKQAFASLQVIQIG